MHELPFAAVMEKIEAVYPGIIHLALQSYAHKHGLDPTASPVTQFLDRGFCYSGVLWRVPLSDETQEEHQFLTIPEAGGVVPEKRHFRLLANPTAAEDPWVIIGEEFVTVLCGVLTIFGLDVDKSFQINPGEERLSYGCYCDQAKREIRWFQDRHGLRAEKPWTTVIFRHRYIPLSRLAHILGSTHPDVLEIQSREIAPLGGKERKT